MDQIRREPFRVFFPLGILLAWVGVFPWLALGLGRGGAWPAAFHAALMTQAFLTAMAVGFLGTMLPRRTGAAPLTRAQLGVISAALLAIPLLQGGGAPAAAQLAFVAVLAVLGRYAVGALRSTKTPRQPPPSFVWLPAAVLLSLVGAALSAAGQLGWGGVLGLGRKLAQQGMVLGLVLGLAPMLSPLIASGEAPDPTPRRAALLRSLHLLLALLLTASFAVEQWASITAGLALRAAVVAVGVIGTGRLWQRRTKPGLHRALFRVALWAIPAGLLGASLMPAQQIAWLHLTFIAGLGLLVFSVSVHVTLLHTGHEPAAAGRPAAVALGGALLLTAAAVRTTAEGWGQAYLSALGGAAALWLLAGLLWATYLIPMLWPGRARPDSP